MSYPVVLRESIRPVTIHRVHFQTESHRPLRDFLSNSSEAEDTETLSRKLMTS